MRFVSVKNSILPIYIGVVTLLSIVFVANVGAVSTSDGTVISAQVCDNTGSTVSITNPKNDSVVNQSTIEVKGKVANATQLSVTVDGNFSQTIPIGSTQKSYSFKLTLSEGTHTVHVEANDVCGISNGTSQIVVTFETNAGPSTGGETPTTAGGVLVGGEPIETKDEDVYQKIKNNWLGGPLIRLGENAYDFTGLDATFENSGWVAGALRVMTFSAGMMTIAFTTLALQTYAAGFMEWFGKFLPENPILNHQYQLWTLRGLGLLIMTLAILL